MEKPSQEHYSPSSTDEDRGQNRRQFKGIRMRKWGRWVSEIRMTKTREKIWLGSYKTAEQAARAYDAALYCLRGPNAKFNFPDSVRAIPSVSSLSRQQIQVAAAKYALEGIPSTSTSPSIPVEYNNKPKEKPESQPRPSVLETKRSLDSQQILKALDLELWDSPFDGNGGLNLEKIPSIEEASVLEFIPTWQEEEQPEDYIFFDPTDLWNF